VDKKNPMRHASKFVTDYLFPAGEVPQQNFVECIGEDPRVLDLVIGDLDCFRNIELVETFQKDDNEALTSAESGALLLERENLGVSKFNYSCGPRLEALSKSG